MDEHSMKSIHRDFIVHEVLEDARVLNPAEYRREQSVKPIGAGTLCREWLDEMKCVHPSTKNPAVPC